jgi:hypothetical protein
MNHTFTLTLWQLMGIIVASDAALAAIGAVIFFLRHIFAAVGRLLLAILIDYPVERFLDRRRARRMRERKP